MIVKYLYGLFIFFTSLLPRFWNDCVCYEELKNWLVDQGFEEIWCEIWLDWQGNALFINRKKITPRP